MTAWVALAMADLVAVASAARCFTGPGELTAALMTLTLVHLAALAARAGLGGRRRIWWALAVAAAAVLPLAMVLGSGLFSGFPGQGAWHGVVTELPPAWRTFFADTAPVPELPGLVLALAWTAGAVGLASELLSRPAKTPAAFGLLPALGLYLFSSALGRGSWSVIGLGAMAGSACLYLAAAARGHQAASAGLVLGPRPGTRDPGVEAAGRRARAMLVRVCVLAAIAAAVVGPNLPGARSAALLAWHSSGGTSNAGPTGSGSGGGASGQPVEVSTLVQVAEEEVDDPSVTLFSVHSPRATREVVAILTEFDGSSWSTSSSAVSTPLGTFPVSLKADESQPPPLVADGPGHAKLVQVFEDTRLGGRDLPTWGDVLAIAHAGPVSRLGPSGSVVSDTALRAGTSYAVASVISDPSALELSRASVDAADPAYTQLPVPVPTRLARLAAGLVKGASGPYDEALKLENYLTSPRFRYELPARTASGVVSPSSGYDALESFLFDTRTGYCQQFATAFAVLARIDHLPTRIAVGFVRGTPGGHDEWNVEGSDTHAWPQVLFSGYGWIDFEPTPGTTTAGSSAPSSSGSARPTASSSVPTTTPVVSTVPVSKSATTNPSGHRSASSPGAGPVLALWLAVPPLALFAWVGGVILWRRSRLRRLRRQPRSVVLAAWGEASRTLAARGVARRRAETHLELASRVVSAGVLSTEAELALCDLASAATSAWYGRSSPKEASASQAIADALAVVRSARRGLNPWWRLMSVLDPREILA